MPTSAPPLASWTVTAVDEAVVDALAAATGLSGVVARICVVRGLSTPEAVRAFLTPDLDRDWRSPEELPGMPACADRVARAVRDRERIVVFGDFDVDGLTAAALAARGLAAMGADVTATVPHRFEEGYGLSVLAVERLIGLAPSLVITVDCGISNAAEVGLLVAAGVDVVVTDHHEPGEDVPSGVPVCDPKLADDVLTELAGAGVALKLVAAVGARTGHPDVWRDLTDLAAMGTVGDVVPLLGENRAIVADGLTGLRAGKRAGVVALCDAAGAVLKTLTAENIAFALAPRLNAAGRIADPAEALALLMADDPTHARTLASALDAHNTARQSAEAELSREAIVAAEAVWREGARVLIVAGEGWHEGVRGIVASRLVGRYGVPALVFCIADGEARGSGRSVGDVDLHAAVTRCSGMLTRFGGHAAAVGVTLPAGSLEEFRRCMEEALSDVPAEAFSRTMTADAEVHLWEATKELSAGLAVLEPFGAANPKPLLASRGVFMNARALVGRDREHFKFDAYDGVTSVPAIAFRCADASALAVNDAAVDVLFSLDTSTWQGRQRVQLMVRRILPHVSPSLSPAAELVDELFADADRILARGEYANIADAESFHTKLAGVTFEDRQEVLARLEPGDVLRLVRQPENPYDANAVALYELTGAQVGFFNKRLAAALAPEIDRGAAFDVTVTEVTGGEAGESRGVNVLVSRAGALEADALDAEARAARRVELGALSAAELDTQLTRALIGDLTLHDAQRDSLAHLAAGRSCLTVMATGRGKSLIFHLHAARVALARGQASIFVYPLRALVADQAFHLEDVFEELGLTVRLITGETSPTRRDELFAALDEGGVDVLMTTPEFLDRHAARFAAGGRVGFVVIDEAHHVGLARASHRPAYARLGEALEVLGRPVVCAVTATADDEVAATIRRLLAIDEVVLDPTQRDNLRVADRRGMPDKPGYLATLAASGDKLIIYVNSREQSVTIAQGIRDASPRLMHATAFYNGGMGRAARHAVERAFRDGSITTVVATSAFGEGVNIPDVRNVALFHLPFNRVEFNQMCGRVGRDGRPATVHLLFGARDGRLNEMILESSAPELDDLRTLYAALRARAALASDGWVEATNAELAEDTKKRRSRSHLTDRGVSTGLGVFRELGFVTGEGAGVYRRLAVVPDPARVELTTSVRYAEGVDEVEEFEVFRAWVLGAPAEELLAAFDRPILPGS